MAEVDVDAAANYDDEYMDAAQPRDEGGYDDEVRDVAVDDDADSASGQPTSSAAHTGSTPARPTQRHAEHHIGTPGTTRSRTKRGGTPAREHHLAPPPMFRPPSAHTARTDFARHYGGNHLRKAGDLGSH